MHFLIRLLSVRFATFGVLLFMLISLLSRLILLWSAAHDVSWSLSLLGAFVTGMVFVSNYQKIALLEDDCIAILKPNRKFSVWSCNRTTGAFGEAAPGLAATLLHDTAAYYQSSSWLFRSGGLKRAASEESVSASATSHHRVIPKS